MTTQKSKDVMVIYGCMALIMLVFIGSCKKSPEQQEPTQTPEQQELARLQGKWEGVVDGHTFSLVISGNSFEIAQDHFDDEDDGEIDNSGSLKINIESNPKEIDLLCEEGENVGETYFGIYKIEGDKFSLFGDEDQRPVDFSDENGDLIVFTKQ